MAWTGTGIPVPTVPTAYLAYADLVLRCTNLDDLIPDGKDAEVWTGEFIDDACAEIDAALLPLYTRAQLLASALVKRIAFGLTHYLILRENFRQEQAEVSDWVVEIRDEARELLQKLIDGALTLDTDAVALTVSSTSEDRDREFTQTFYDEDGVAIDTGSMETW